MELLSETAHLSEEHSTLLRIARTCGEQLSTVIDDILDFTKLQEKKVALQAEEFGLRELLERVVEIASLSIRSKSMELLLAPTSPDVRTTHSTHKTLPHTDKRKRTHTRLSPDVVADSRSDRCRPVATEADHAESAKQRRQVRPHIATIIALCVCAETLSQIHRFWRSPQW